MKLKLKDVCFGYTDDNEILNNVNVEVEEGEFVTIFGDSGIGKSTILKLICGLLPLSKGNIYLDGKDVTNVSPHLRNIVLTLQDSYLFPHMNVFDNISFSMRMKKIDKKIIDKRVAELLSIIDLVGYDKKKPKELSGGEKKRVSLARAVSIVPNVLLLDEPFVGLDDSMRIKMRDLVKLINSEFGITVILVTHDYDDAVEVSDRILKIEEGVLNEIWRK